jgi:LacI family transcriptional regulator
MTQPRRPGLVTIRDVARRAGVSIATVSRVLNNTPRGVAPALQRRVLRAAQKLDYRPNALARSLHQKHTHTLGLVIPDIANPYYAEITRGIEDVCRQSGYAVFICNTDRNPGTMAHYLQILREKRVDAIIIGGGGTHARRHSQILQGSSVPTLLIGRYDVDLPAVRIDNVKGAWEAATHLIRLGHRRIAILSGPKNSTSMHDRIKGYRRALNEHALALPREWLLYGDLRPASAFSLAQHLLTTRPAPTGILAANDQMAVATIRAATQLGIGVPKDVSVVGFDNIELASYITPRLTTMKIPLYQIGVAVAENAKSLIAGTPGNTETWFYPELIVRESTGPPPGARGRRRNTLNTPTCSGPSATTLVSRRVS